jgi:hypothetical protein
MPSGTFLVADSPALTDVVIPASYAILVASPDAATVGVYIWLIEPRDMPLWGL